ncbi:MAG: hypothetical protein U0Q07_04385 [Acidimicrobiales bacterium]
MWTMKRQRRDEVGAAVVAAEVVTVRVLQARHPDQALPIFAAPGRCLRCDDMALVERVDAAAGRAHHRCHACGASWTMSRAALRRAAAEDRDRATVVVGGTLVESLVETEAAVPLEPVESLGEAQRVGAHGPPVLDGSERRRGLIVGTQLRDVPVSPALVTPLPPARSRRVGASPRVRFVV